MTSNQIETYPAIDGDNEQTSYSVSNQEKAQGKDYLLSQFLEDMITIDGPTCATFTDLVTSIANLDARFCHYTSYQDSTIGYRSGLVQLSNVFIDTSGTHVIHIPSASVIKTRGCLADLNVTHQMLKQFEQMQLNEQQKNQDMDIFGQLDDGQNVLFIDKAISFLHRWSSNFYHKSIDIIPRLLLAIPLLQSDPAIPLLTISPLSKKSVSMLGLQGKQLQHLIVRQKPAFFFVRDLYIPLMPSCEQSSAPLMQEVRKRIVDAKLKSTEQKENWHTIDYLQIANTTYHQNPLKILLFLRKGTREFQQENAITAALIERFGKESIHFTDGSIKFHDAFRIFSDTHLLIGVHGAGLTNMIWLPPKAAVMEITPTGFIREFFVNLSKALNLAHFRIFGEGDKHSLIAVDPSIIVKTAEQILGL
jgi:hypothetical protein